MGLYEIGYHVNNSIVHLYRRKKEFFTLDGGQWGSFISFDGRRNIINTIKHLSNGALNHIIDVFCANSITIDVLGKQKQKQISEIVGEENVASVGDLFLFSLPHMEKLSIHYKLHNRKMILKLKEIIG